MSAIEAFIKKAITPKQPDITALEFVVAYHWQETKDFLPDAEVTAKAVEQLAYLQSCAAEWEFFATLEGTPETKVAFMRQTVEKLAKMRGKS